MPSVPPAASDPARARGCSSVGELAVHAPIEQRSRCSIRSPSKDRAARDIGLQQPPQRSDQLGEAVVDAFESPLTLDIAMNMNSGTAVSANESCCPAHQAEAIERREAALHGR